MGLAGTVRARAGRVEERVWNTVLAPGPIHTGGRCNAALYLVEKHSNFFGLGTSRVVTGLLVQEIALKCGAGDGTDREYEFAMTVTLNTGGTRD